MTPLRPIQTSQDRETREDLMARVALMDREALDEFYAVALRLVHLAPFVGRASTLTVGVREQAPRLSDHIEAVLANMKSLEGK